MPTGSVKPTWPLRFAPHMGYAGLDQPFFAHSVRSTDPVEHIRYIADRGFAGIDDHLLTLRPAAEQERMGAALSRYGLQFGSFGLHNNLASTAVWGARTAEARQRLKEDLSASIEVARRVNGKFVTVVARRDLRTPSALQIVNMTENLRELSNIAARADVVLVLEQTSETRVPGMLLHHILDAYSVVKAVDSAAVRLVFDVVHVQIMDGDVIENLNRVWDGVALIQIGDNPGRLEPGTGELNFVNILRTIKHRNFEQLVVLEHAMSLPGAEGEQRALDSLRAICDRI